MKSENNSSILPLFQENLGNAAFNGVVTLQQRYTREGGRSHRWTQCPLLLNKPPGPPMCLNGAPCFPRLYGQIGDFPLARMSFIQTSSICSIPPHLSGHISKDVFMQLFQISQTICHLPSLNLSTLYFSNTLQHILPCSSIMVYL